MNSPGSAYVQNDSTTNNIVSGFTNGNVGLNVYQIVPKIKSYAMAGANGIPTAPTDVILGGAGTSLLITGIQFGLQNPRTYYFNSAVAERVIKYTYVDSSGNEQTTTQTCTVANKWYPTPLAIGINEFNITGTNVNFGSSDTIYLNTTNSGNTYLGSIYSTRYQYNGLFTCPNNAIAMITSIDGLCSTSVDLYYMNIWDASGNRSVPYLYVCNTGTINNFKTAGGGEYGCIGRIIKAGESVAFSSYSTTSGSKSIWFNVLVRYF